MVFNSVLFNSIVLNKNIFSNYIYVVIINYLRIFKQETLISSKYCLKVYFSPANQILEFKLIRLYLWLF